MGHIRGAVLATLALTAALCIPVADGAWGIYRQPGFNEGRSIAAAHDDVYVGGLSLGSFSGYQLLKYNATGDVAWEKQFPVPERRMTREKYRHVAVAATEDTVRIAFSNGTFDIKAYNANGTRLWENRWRRQCSVTDMALLGTHTVVAGCADDVSEPRYHLVAFGESGMVAWNASGRGCIHGIAIHNDTVLAAGERDGAGLLISVNETGAVTDTRIFAQGAIRDIAVTADGIVLLHSTEDNMSLQMVPSMTANDTTLHYYGKTAAGSAVLAAEGRLLVAGSIYNHTSKNRDFLIAEYLPNGTFTDGIRQTANGSDDDIAWDLAGHDGVVATGAVYTSHIIHPPDGMPYSVLNREIYTVTYQPDNLPPTANFTWDPDTPRANDRVSFTETASDPDGTIVQLTWNFGDGATAFQQDPSHVYTDKGVYTVSLTVQDDDGATHTATREIVIAEEEKTPSFSVALACLAAMLALALRRRLTFK